MDWAAYIVTLQGWVEAMQSSEDYSVDFELYPGVLPEEIEEIEGYLRAEPGLEEVHIPDDLRSFYRETSRFSLDWYSEIPQQDPWRLVQRGGRDVNVNYGAPSGHAYIVLLSELYTPVERHQAGERDIPFASLYEDYRTFDHLSGDRICTRFAHGRPEPALFYYDKRAKGYYPLTLDFTTYMTTLLEGRALFGWQRFFIADPEYPLEPEWIEWFHENLARFAPDVDASRFQR